MDYKYYLNLDVSNLVTNAYVLQKNALPKDAEDILYLSGQPREWSIPNDLKNQYGEPKWLYSNGQLIEQTEQSLEGYKVDLKEAAKDFYLNDPSIRCIKIISASLQEPITYPISRQAITDATNTAASGYGYIYKDYNTAQQIDLTNQQIAAIQKHLVNTANSNKSIYVDHKFAIDALASKVEYDITANYLANNEINLDEATG